MSDTAWHSVGYQEWAQVRPTLSNFEFQVVKRATQVFDSVIDAADYTAGVMVQQWDDRPWYLALSGGIDSEFVANTLVRNNIAFTPLILKIKGINELEYWYAEYWCKKNCITPHVVEFQPNDLETFIPDYLRTVRNTRQVGILINLAITRIVQQLNGYTIFSTGDINFDKDRQQFYCNAIDYVGDIYLSGTNPSAFFVYTPEMVLSYIRNFSNTTDEQHTKLDFYGVSPRPKINYLSNLFESTSKLKNFASLMIAYGDPSHHWFDSWQHIIDSLEPCND